jgi:hypothetical protein
MNMVDILHGPQCDSNAILEYIYEVGLDQCIEVYDFIVLIIYQPTEVLSTARQLNSPVCFISAFRGDGLHGIDLSNWVTASASRQPGGGGEDTLAAPSAESGIRQHVIYAESFMGGYNATLTQPISPVQGVQSHF